MEILLCILIAAFPEVFLVGLLGVGLVYVVGYIVVGIVGLIIGLFGDSNK